MSHLRWVSKALLPLACMTYFATTAYAVSEDEADAMCVPYGRLAADVWAEHARGVSVRAVKQEIDDHFTKYPQIRGLGYRLVNIIYVNMPDLSRKGAIHAALLDCNLVLENK
jgi:hypothetical protein